jgi:hypothetical protein
MSILVSAAPALAALPTVNTFAVAATAVSPVPVTAFTASDSDGTVVGYMITQTSTKPAAGDSRWTGTPWTSYETASIGSRTLYAWAKDNANGVSNSRTATTNVVGGHVHPIGQVTGLTTALSGKADVGHNHDGVYQQKYGKVAVVAQSGGDYTDPVVAMSNIALWCGTPSSSNACLLKIMPGVYDLGALTLELPAFVDMIGAGEDTTTIRGSAENVLLMWGSDVRSLTIENAGSTTILSNAIRVQHGSAKFTGITVKVLGSQDNSQAIGMVVEDTQVALRDVTVFVDGNGRQAIGLSIYNYPGSKWPADLSDVTIKVFDGGASLGIQAGSSDEQTILNNGNIDVSGRLPNADCVGIDATDMTVRNSEVRSTMLGILSTGMRIVGSRIVGGNFGNSLAAYGGTTKVSFSELDGPVSGSGFFSCFNVHDENLGTVTCP